MDPRLSIIDKRLSKINKIIAIASGKGGVGKSLVASALSLSLSMKGYKVGLLDLDIYGPSTHVILGVTDFDFPEEEKGILPYKLDRIKYMSIVFFTKDKPAPLRGVNITNTIVELLSITQWSELDYLIIDLPPGIGDETLDLIRFVKRSEFLVVTTPSKVAMRAVIKLLTILMELKLPIIGVLENMKMNDSNYIRECVSSMKIRYIGHISFDKNIEEAIGLLQKLKLTRFLKEFKELMNDMIKGDSG
jgi:ATP-binding protein involved in chromosome partitioning